jgi:hypothetical protein
MDQLSHAAHDGIQLGLKPGVAVRLKSWTSPQLTQKKRINAPVATPSLRLGPVARRKVARWRQRVVETASWLAAVATAVTALVGTMESSGLYIAISSAGAVLLATLTLTVEWSPPVIRDTSFNARPVRGLLLAALSVVVFFGFCLSLGALIQLAPPDSLPTDRSAPIAAAGVVAATIVDPWTQGWREDFGQNMLRWARNGVIAVAASYSFLGAYSQMVDGHIASG